MTFAQWTHSLVNIGNTIIVPLIITLAFLVFIFGVFKYFFLAGPSGEGREEGKQFVIWGILGMVVLFGVWGIVNLLITTLGFSS